MTKPKQPRIFSNFLASETVADVKVGAKVVFTHGQYGVASGTVLSKKPGGDYEVKAADGKLYSVHPHFIKKVTSEGRKAVSESTVLPSANTSHGFWGTLSVSASEKKRHWIKAFGAVELYARRLGVKMAPIDVRNLLDSGTGRHLADQWFEPNYDPEYKDTAEREPRVAFAKYGSDGVWRRAFQKIVADRELFGENVTLKSEGIDPEKVKVGDVLTVTVAIGNLKKGDKVKVIKAAGPGGWPGFEIDRKASDGSPMKISHNGAKLFTA